VAEDASRLKDDFLATLSHEIRTPLNAVIGWSRMLRTGVSVSSREHALDVIDRNARLQLRLVEDLLDMSRILSGKLQLKTGTVSFLDVVRAAVEVITPAAAARKIDVRLFVESDESPVTGDADRLQQVVWNLLSNAVKFTTAGGSIRVDVDFGADDVRLTVRDTGQGIDPEFLPFVFDRFRQADASASRRQGGLGLGLALVKQIVELHGGTVGAESAGHGAGSAFWVTLPLAGAGESSTTLPQAPDVTLAGVSVLIVDDDDDARELLVALLGQYGARVRGAASGADALELLNDHADEPDVLVADIGMPGIDGYALIRRIRAMESDGGRRLPAIAVTAYANPEDRVKALVAGYQTHIAKPIDSALLATAIAGLVADKVRSEGL
jgi:CheY-like chemotaxis protein/two-component sensor histidine kinase